MISTADLHSGIRDLTQAEAEPIDHLVLSNYRDTLIDLHRWIGSSLAISSGPNLVPGFEDDSGKALAGLQLGRSVATYKGMLIIRNVVSTPNLRAVTSVDYAEGGVSSRYVLGNVCHDPDEAQGYPLGERALRFITRFWMEKLQRHEVESFGPVIPGAHPSTLTKEQIPLPVIHSRSAMDD